MSAIRLLVLGAVRRRGRAHGYQVRGDLDYGGDRAWSRAGPGSVYHALRQLAKEGLLRAHDRAPSTAGGPPRTEYELTAAGGEAYAALLRASLARYDQAPGVFGAALGCVVDLPREEAVALLEERLRGLREWRRGVAAYGTPGEASGHLGEVMDLWLHAADSDAAWTRGLIERIAGGAYVFAGEGEPRAPVPGEGPEHPDPAKGAAPRETAGPANDTLQAGPANGAP